jgi:peptidoglycan/LPS O-acetylase OafA/YrhL
VLAATSAAATLVKETVFIRRYAALDAWRGLCAIIVVLHHYAPAGGLVGSSPVVINGFLFVDFFFVLSGFVISHSYGSKLRTVAEFLAFLWGRFARLWPLHALILVALIVLEVARAAVGARMGTVAPVFSGHFPLATLPTQFLFLESFGINERLTWNGPSWSISSEFFVAVLFGLVCLALPARRFASAALAIVASALLLIAWVSPRFMNAAHDYGFVRCCADFFSGVLCFRRLAGAPLATPPPSKLACTVQEAAVVAVVLLLVASSGETPVSLLAPLVFSVAVGVFALERGKISKTLHWRGFQALGAWSYSIYMLQVPVVMVIYFVWRLIAKREGEILQSSVATLRMLHEIAEAVGLSALLHDAPALGYLVAILLTARLSHRYIELPCQAALRSLLAGRAK